MKFAQPIAIVGLTRTHIGRLGGALSKTRPHELLAACFEKTLSDASAKGFKREMLVDVIVGNVRNSIGNIARVTALHAGLDESLPAATVDRQCASSMEALSIAACRVLAGGEGAVLVGGVESASLAPWLFEKTTRPYAYMEPRPFDILMSPPSYGNVPMGETAEILADEFGLTREAMDRFSADSHEKAAEARANGAFDDEICPIASIAADESIRAETTVQSLATLRTVFRKEGRLTAGNSSPLNDGATSCVVMTQSTAEALGIEPDALLLGIDTIGLDPRRMGLGPALTIPRLLSEFSLAIDDIDLVEINEAFSAQVLAVLAHLKSQSGIVVPKEKLNVNGGAIALGHPLGATGLRLVVTLVNTLKRRSLNRGVASLCVGGGQGMSAMVSLTL